MTKKSIIKELDREIKETWLDEICREYGDGHFLLEAGLQCAYYHHLRNRLDGFLRDNGLFLYPEFYIREFGYYADLAIVSMDMAVDSEHLQDKVSEIFALVELKIGGSKSYIKTDLPKIKDYVQNLSHDCQVYFGVIDENAVNSGLRWLDGRSIGHWPEGWFTELDAGWVEDKMFFEVNSYNNLNFSYRRSECIFTW
ncbi:MAG: hypothetical protein J5966_00505 [Lachnospiraceae bacterium]|nr:hypothetical protein [Lachnospiraceae bacterium]